MPRLTSTALLAISLYVLALLVEIVVSDHFEASSGSIESNNRNPAVFSGNYASSVTKSSAGGSDDLAVYTSVRKGKIVQALPDLLDIAKKVIQLALSIGGNGNRVEFVKSVIRHVNSLGYNVVVVHPKSEGHGYEAKVKLTLRSGGRNLDYMVYMARRNKVMQVTNKGDGGWKNWGLMGRWWVRWGKTVRFHNHWNYKTMGKPYEVRPAKDLPPL